MKKKPDSLTTVLGGTELEVTRIDGTKERVQVRALPITKMQEYLDSILDEIATVALSCDRSRAWAESLTPQSFNQVAETGVDLNLPFFSAWMKRRMRVTEAMRPGFIDQVNRNVDGAINAAASRSANSSPTSPSAQG